MFAQNSYINWRYKLRKLRACESRGFAGGVSRHAAEKCVLEYLMKIPVGWAGIIKAAESRRRGVAPTARINIKLARS